MVEGLWCLWSLPQVGWSALPFVGCFFLFHFWFHPWVHPRQLLAIRVPGEWWLRDNSFTRAVYSEWILNTVRAASHPLALRSSKKGIFVLLFICDFFPAFPGMFLPSGLSPHPCAAQDVQPGGVFQSSSGLSAPASRAFPALHVLSPSGLQNTSLQSTSGGPWAVLSLGVSVLELCRDSNKSSGNGSEEIPSALPCFSCSPAPLLQCTKLITGGLDANEPIKWFFCGSQVVSACQRLSLGCWRSWREVQAAGNFVVLCAQSLVGFFTLREMGGGGTLWCLSGIFGLSGAVQIPGNSLSQLFILFMARLSGWGRTEGRQDPSSDSWGFLWFQ